MKRATLTVEQEGHVTIRIDREVQSVNDISKAIEEIRRIYMASRGLDWRTGEKIKP